MSLHLIRCFYMTLVVSVCYWVLLRVI